MKAKKAAKRLAKADELIARVIKRYDGSTSETKRLLGSARDSIKRAGVGAHSHPKRKKQHSPSKGGKHAPDMTAGSKDNRRAANGSAAL